MNANENLERLAEFLENDLAKKLLESYRNGEKGPSLKTVLEKVTLSKESVRDLNDQAEVD